MKIARGDRFRLAPGGNAAVARIRLGGGANRGTHGP